MGVNSEMSNDDENATDDYRPTGMQMGSRSVLTIAASTGIFMQTVRWCQCASNSDQYVQLLLWAKLFPASFINLKTAFTFEVLDHFRIDALECKTSAMTFISKLRCLTNEAFPSKVLVSCPTDWISFRFAFGLTMWRRIDTGSCLESHGSGGTCTISFGGELYMIDPMFRVENME